MELKDILRLAGAFALGFILAKLVDPPPPEIVEAIASSKWAREYAEAFCGGTGKEHEECVREVARRIAERVASRLF